MTSLLERIGISVPIVQAPMAGGPDTPELAAAVSNAGGLGSIGCAYLSARQIDEAAAAVRARTSAPFALNLFVRADVPPDADAQARAEPIVRAFRRELGLDEPPASAPPASDSFDAQLEAVLRAQPRVFSFTFGAPAREQVRALHDRSIVAIGTATTVEEAEALEAIGVDAICAQGAEAGGHRGTFLGRFEDGLVGILPLVRQIAARMHVPVLAAGGIMDGAAIAAMLTLGASAVQLGTAFLLCPEAGTSAPYRAALRSPAAQRTVVTRAFSGRAARGIRNRFTDAFENEQAAPFPFQQQLTRELRAEATRQGRADLMQLWAGQAAPLARAMPAAELMKTLMAELEAARASSSGGPLH
ncbi:MAG TPA: nitronate monooxygenase [Polyangia bacterium]|nr:nitronate monooxygenase [Polyangia bacterium]